MLKDPFELLNNYVSVPHGTFDKLKIYHGLLLKWQQRINLISNDTINDIWHRHFLDSYQLIKLLENNYEKTIIDLGSGAGFPGMVLAIAGYKNIHLIESDKRKAIFLQEVARAVHVNIKIHCDRIENVIIDNKNNIIVSRACASVDKLLHLSSNFVSYETKYFLHKGKNYKREIQDALLNWNYNYSTTKSITDSLSVIIKITDLKKV
ncbi:MAG: 16S rRNA (guanine(527)-N(7))-methyltransferase RsmG [Rickettsiales bacterium]